MPSYILLTYLLGAFALLLWTATACTDSSRKPAPVFVPSTTGTSTSPEQVTPVEPSVQRPTPQPRIIIQDDFEHDTIDESQWIITSEGDFAAKMVDILDVDRTGGVDRRLRVGANTTGTADSDKFLGVMNQRMIDFSGGVTISFELDWNSQRNGSYLTASAYVSPSIGNNPKNEKDWIKFEYAGVPPEGNVRTNVWATINGALRQPYTDWGPRDSAGRPQGRPKGGTSHKIQIYLDSRQARIAEDGIEIYPLSPHNLTFTSGYLYLQMSSGTNYPFRELYFDDVLVLGSANTNSSGLTS